MTNPTKPRKIDLTAKDIYVPILGKEVLPTIIHTVAPMHSLIGDREATLEGELQHTFELVIEPTDVDGWNKDATDPRWPEMKQYVVPKTRAAYEEDGQLIIARLRVIEFPAAHRYDVGERWVVVLSDFDVEGSEIAVMVEELYEADDNTCLLDGGLFFMVRLDVHPAFRGQQIGARLIGSALWQLHRSGGDVAALLAKPVACDFGGEQKPPVTVRAIRRLVRYYERMGFKAWDSGDPIQRNGCVPMYAVFGEDGMLFKGGGWSSSR